MKSRQPNSQHCFVCGIANPVGLKLTFYQTAPGEVSVETIVPEEYQGYPGVVHGGIVASMLDEAAGRAFYENGSLRFMYTANLEVRYRRNVPINKPICIVGRAGESKGRAAAATSAIYDSEGTLLAEAKALLIDIPEEKRNFVNLEEIGWRVYSDDEIAAA